MLGLRGNALMMTITEFFGQGIKFLTFNFWSLYILHLGGSLGAIGIISLIVGIFSLILQVPVGYLCDRIGRKKLVVWGGFLSSLAPFTYALAPRWEWLIPGAILESCNMIVLPARRAMFADALDEKGKGEGFAAFHTLLAIPRTVLPIVGGILLERMQLGPGMRLALLFAGFVMIASSIARWKYLKEEYILTKTESIDAFKVKEFFKETFEPLTSIKKLRVIIIGLCLGTISLNILLNFQVIYAVDIIGLSKIEWGFISGAVGFVSIFTRIPMGRFTDRFGRKASLLLSYGLNPLFILGFAYSNNLLGVLFSSLGDNIISYLKMPTHEALIIEVTTPETRGRAYGTFDVIPGIFKTLSPTFGAFLWESFGAIWCFYISAFMTAISAIFIYIFLSEK
jgi:MFS family permease